MVDIIGLDIQIADLPIYVTLIRHRIHLRHLGSYVQL